MHCVALHVWNSVYVFTMKNIGPPTTIMPEI